MKCTNLSRQAWHGHHTQLQQDTGTGRSSESTSICIQVSRSRMRGSVAMAPRWFRLIPLPDQATRANTKSIAKIELHTAVHSPNQNEGFATCLADAVVMKTRASEEKKRTTRETQRSTILTANDANEERADTFSIAACLVQLLSCHLTLMISTCGICPKCGGRRRDQ